jgi:hypothetical protein
VAITDVKLISIPLSILKVMMQKNRKFEEKVYKGSLIYHVKNIPDPSGPLAK